MLILLLIAAGAASIGATHPTGTKRVAHATVCAVIFGIPKMCKAKPAPTVAPAPVPVVID